MKISSTQLSTLKRYVKELSLKNISGNYIKLFFLNKIICYEEFYHDTLSSFQFQFDQDGDEPLVYKTIPDLVQVPDPEIDMVYIKDNYFKEINIWSYSP